MADSRSADYRARMAECLPQAAHATDSIVREALYERAKMWEELAEEHEAKAIPASSSQAQPIAQQQEQVQPEKKDE